MNTAPVDIAIKVLGIWFIRKSAIIVPSGAAEPAILKNTKYVGALSRKPDKTHVNKKYILFIVLPSLSDTILIIEPGTKNGDIFLVPD